VIERIGEFCGEVTADLEFRPKNEPVWTSLVEAMSQFIKPRQQKPAHHG